ncbi:hypothetical protein N9E02_00745 [Ilumatobacteraceae bacterium]|nr:hypothetical protein [Ilumatobacteraceae bacterium]
MNRRAWIATLLLATATVGAALLAAPTDSSTVLDLEVGDCFVLPDSGWNGRIRSAAVLDCDEALGTAAQSAATVVAALVVAAGDIANGPWPGDSASMSESSRWCAQTPGADAGIVPVAPDEDLWALGGRVLCLRLGR